MPKTVKTRYIDDEVYAALVRRIFEDDVALAQAFDATLLTLSARPPPGPTCRIEVVPRVERGLSPWVYQRIAGPCERGDAVRTTQPCDVD